ncbi:hypothetical protein LIA77_03373 [Sarocladium implicatum]|nr:hypothetical protein LIA77_03373 [Sarocladium implicatum]
MARLTNKAFTTTRNFLGAGRRATTRASRRKATFAEAFTALYSSICATAAVVDAVWKEDRKSKVDAELQDVRDALIELRAQRAVRELERGIPDERPYGDIIEPSDLSDSQNRALWEQWRYIIDNERFLEDAWTMSGSNEETLHGSLVRPFGGSRVEATAILRGACSRILNHISAEEQDDSVKQRVPQNLAQYETTVNRVRAYVKSMLVVADRAFQEQARPRSNHQAYRTKRSRWSPSNSHGFEKEQEETEDSWQQLIADIPKPQSAGYGPRKPSAGVHKSRQPNSQPPDHRWLSLSDSDGVEQEQEQEQTEDSDGFEQETEQTEDRWQQLIACIPKPPSADYGPKKPSAGVHESPQPISQPPDHRWTQQPLPATLQRAWAILEVPARAEWYSSSRFQKENTIQLNKHIRALFQDHSRPMYNIIAEIAICLLISPTLPDVHTLNLLIAGFTRRRWRTLADQSYQLFFSDDNKLRSTPASLALSVTTPAMFWDIPGFKRAAAALVGRDPHVGAKIGRRPLATAVTDEFVGRWASDSARRGIAGRSVWEFAPMDLALREALISSLLHLRQHIDAAAFFLACLQTGASMTPGVIFDVFNAIAKVPDARSALRLVRGIGVRFKHFDIMMRSLPKVIRACVCRRLEYLLFVLDLRHMDVPGIDEVISGLGLCRRHVEKLHDLLNEQGYSNELMNNERASFGMHDEVIRKAARAVRSSKIPDVSGSPLETSPMARSAEPALRIGNDQLESYIHEQIRDAVQAEVERQFGSHGEGAARFRLQARLQQNEPESAAAFASSDGLASNHRHQVSQAVKPSDEDLARKQFETDIERKVRTLVEMQIQERLGQETANKRDLEKSSEEERMDFEQAQAVSWS